MNFLIPRTFVRKSLTLAHVLLPPVLEVAKISLQKRRALEVAKIFAPVAKIFGVMLPFLATGAKQV